MLKRRHWLLGLGSMALLGCVRDYPTASAEEVHAARYAHDGEPALMLISTIGESSGMSEHVGLLINAQERVLFDPAGAYTIAQMPHRDDVHYGVKDRYLEHYISFHARLGFYVKTYYLPVSSQTAQIVYERATHYGQVRMTQCGFAVSDILADIEELKGISRTFFPSTLEREFAALPNVVSSEYHENDVGQNLRKIPVAGLDPDDTAPPPKPEFGR